MVAVVVTPCDIHYSLVPEYTQVAESQSTSQTVSKKEIYRDDHLSVYYASGKDDRYLLCTFGDLYMPRSSGKFFGEKAVQKLDWPCLGFVASKPNWYPAESMAAAVASIAAYLENRHVTTYGASMGGYAAIKFSALLKAQTVVALCPQFSIDPKHGNSIGWIRYFKPEMWGMDINPGDVSGNIFVISDMSFKRDAWHAKKISKQSNLCRIVNIAGVGHAVTPTLAGTENLRNLIVAAREGDVPALQRTVAKCRRKSAYRVMSVLDRVILRGTFEWPKGSAEEVKGKYSDAVLDRCAQTYLRNLSIDDCSAHTRRGLLSRVKTGLYSAEECSPFAKESRSRGILRSKHGAILTYCPIAEKVVGSRDGNSLPEVSCEVYGDKALLSISLGGIKFYLSGNDSKEIALSNWRPVDSLPYFDFTCTGSEITLAQGGRYVSISPDRVVNIKAKAVTAWEQIRPDYLGGVER